MTTNEIISPQSKKSNNNFWIALAVIAAFLLSAFLWKAYLATEAGKEMVEKPQIESALDTFMKRVVAKDIEGTYALFSPHAQQQYTISFIRRLIESESYSVFKGYKSLSVPNLDFTTAANINPDFPQDNSVIVIAEILYEGGYTGVFKGSVEKVDNVWRIQKFDGIVAQYHQ
jgi:hypothetical protein